MEDFSTVNIWGREDMKNLLKNGVRTPERFERRVKSEVIFKASPSPQQLNKCSNQHIFICTSAKLSPRLDL